MKGAYQRLGIETNYDDELNKFFIRVYSSVHEINNLLLPGKKYDNVLAKISKHVSFKLGVIKDQKISNYLFVKISSFKPLNEFLLACELLLDAFNEYDFESYAVLTDTIERALDASVIDLGITFRDDKFYPTGAEELDNTLKYETLEWLTDYPASREPFESALREFLQKDYADAVTKAYSSLESLVKTYLESEKRLDKNIPELMKRLELPQQWKSILDNFCKYAHEFASRHGKAETSGPVNPEPKDVEAYIYMTGLVMRLIIRSVRDK